MPDRLPHTFRALQQPARTAAEDRLLDRIVAAALKDAGILREKGNDQCPTDR